MSRSVSCPTLLSSALRSDSASASFMPIGTSLPCSGCVRQRTPSGWASGADALPLIRAASRFIADHPNPAYSPDVEQIFALRHLHTRLPLAVAGVAAVCALRVGVHEGAKLSSVDSGSVGNMLVATLRVPQEDRGLRAAEGRRNLVARLAECTRGVDVELPQLPAGQSVTGFASVVREVSSPKVFLSRR